VTPTYTCDGLGTHASHCHFNLEKIYRLLRQRQVIRRTKPSFQSISLEDMENLYPIKAWGLNDIEYSKILEENQYERGTTVQTLRIFCRRLCKRGVFPKKIKCIVIGYRIQV